ncbi:MAG TPA: acyl-[ACP]--phospholipid O-acyltransferase [Gammaproteobacteria bacterium]|nr:acyl-[ACP]--phospholipid O-acyltransferase [Gammaproteobacteria bacterium]
MLNKTLRWLLGKVFQVEVHGLKNLNHQNEPTLFISNHTSFLDAVLLQTFIPGKLTFAVNSEIANRWYARLVHPFIALFPMNPANTLSLRALIQRIKQGGQVVIFPEGRITINGSLMKVYPGPGLVAQYTQAKIIPIRINGAQYSYFSRMKGRVKRRCFPKITLTVLPPNKIKLDESLCGRNRRIAAGKMLSDMMTEMMFESTERNKTLLQTLLDARKIQGGKHIIAEDIERKPQTYHQILTKTVALGNALSRLTEQRENVGILLPNSIANIATFLALQQQGRVPAMLNFSIGVKGIISACETADIKRVITSRHFVKKGKLEDIIKRLAKQVNVLYLEDVAKNMTHLDKLTALFVSRFDSLTLKPSQAIKPDDPAVILFTSGSEGTPKGVVLSHKNLLCNQAQLAARVDFNSLDIVLNALPMFHSFGLTAATLLPLSSGMRVFLYPSPMHYRIIPEIAYDINATLLFGTNTFLSGYARYAHDYDFSSLRYVFAGAEKLKPDVRQDWESRFGVKVFEGYGATETSPVIAANGPMENQAGSVGRALPGIKTCLIPVEGIHDAGRLLVSGPNVMQGYLLHDNPGKLVPPYSKEKGAGWHDTGDIVSINADGYITIEGRAKRFAKIAGEMVSLSAVESLASRAWPDILHAVIAIADEKKGEQLILFTEQPNAKRSELLAQAKADGISEINVPRKIIRVKSLPVLGTGKIDYANVKTLPGML